MHWLVVKSALLGAPISHIESFTAASDNKCDAGQDFCQFHHCIELEQDKYVPAFSLLARKERLAGGVWYCS